MPGLRITGTFGDAKRDATTPNGDVYTLIGWYYTANRTGATEQSWALVINRPSADFDAVRFDLSPASPHYFHAANSETFSASDDKWYGLVLRRNGTAWAFDLYEELNATPVFSASGTDGASPSTPASSVQLLHDGNAGHGLWNARIWTSYLSTSDCWAELNSISAIAASPWACWEMRSGDLYSDSSGNGRSLNVTTGTSEFLGAGPAILNPSVAGASESDADAVATGTGADAGTFTGLTYRRYRGPNGGAGARATAPVRSAIAPRAEAVLRNTQGGLPRALWSDVFEREYLVDAASCDDAEAIATAYASIAVAGLSETDADASATAAGTGALAPVAESDDSAQATASATGAVAGSARLEGEGSGTASAVGSVVGFGEAESDASASLSADGAIIAATEDSSTGAASVVGEASTSGSTGDDDASVALATGVGSIAGETFADDSSRTAATGETGAGSGTDLAVVGGSFDALLDAPSIVSLSAVGSVSGNVTDAGDSEASMTAAGAVVARSSDDDSCIAEAFAPAAIAASALVDAIESAAAYADVALEGESVDEASPRALVQSASEFAIVGEIDDVDSAAAATGLGVVAAEVSEAGEGMLELAAIGAIAGEVANDVDAILGVVGEFLIGSAQCLAIDSHREWLITHPLPARFRVEARIVPTWSTARVVDSMPAASIARTSSLARVVDAGAVGETTSTMPRARVSR